MGERGEQQRHKQRIRETWKVPTLATEVRVVVTWGVFWAPRSVLHIGLGASYTGVSFAKIYGDGQLYMQIFVCI